MSSALRGGVDQYAGAFTQGAVGQKAGYRYAGRGMNLEPAQTENSDFY
jgi:hypothetical protein